MRTVVLDPPTAGLEEVFERRRRSGLDRLDEVWEGVLHMVPAPSYGHARLGQQLAEILGPRALDEHAPAGADRRQHEREENPRDNQRQERRTPHQPFTRYSRAARPAQLEPFPYDAAHELAARPEETPAHLAYHRLVRQGPPYAARRGRSGAWLVGPRRAGATPARRVS